MTNIFIKTGTSQFYVQNVESIFEDNKGGSIEFHGRKENEFLMVSPETMEYYFSCDMDSLYKIPLELRQKMVEITFNGDEVND